MVLVIVLVFALLLVSSIATFLRRATIDSFVVRHRDAAARAEALARGGVELGVALLLEDRLEEEASTEGGFRVESRFDPWARVADLELDVGDGASLRLEIEDAGARLNLNALTVDAEGPAPGREQGLPEDGDPEQTQSFTEADAEAFLRAFLEKVVEEMPGRPEQKNYEVEELVLNLMDWVDADDVRRRGGAEDEWYQGRKPPYRAANRPLLSVDELRLVQGFDGKLVEALAPYVGVFPLAPKAAGDGEEAVSGLGVNPNTAPSWVLALLYHGDPAGGAELAQADEVTAIVKEREKHLLCARAGGDAPGGGEDDGALTSEACVDLLEAADVDPSTIFPPPTWQSDFFTVAAEATVGEIRRRLEVVVDRSDPSEVRRLAWRMR
jgi:type II secretory pathway component PulK